MAFDQINYTHQEHMHRYACWAAARAAQRGWKGGSVDNIKAAIEAVNLRENLLELQQCKIDDVIYKERHARLANEMIAFFNKKGIEAKYGRVAKVIAIYVKTVYVIKNPFSPLSKVAYPPIDRKLLLEVKSCKATPPYDHSVSWTVFDEPDHEVAIEYLRQLVTNRPFWEVERFWNP